MTSLFREHSPESIVVGVDGSSPSCAAIRWSIRRAGSTGARVMLAHIMNDEVSKHAGDAFLLRQLEFARALNHGVRVTGELFQGDPLEALSSASEHGELLAVGTHKTGFIQGRIFGSRFIPLAALTFSPVAFIPNSASTDAQGSWWEWVTSSPTKRRSGSPRAKPPGCMRSS